ncbi:MAG: hypothetical protein QM692_11760 [Thermomicrobiales bacterium]
MDRWARRDAPFHSEPLQPASPADCAAFAAQAAEVFEHIAGDAVVAMDMSLDAQGQFVDARTGAPIQAVAEEYSRMKYGDLDAVDVFAGHIAVAAMESARFLQFNRDAIANERVISITTAGVFNVPSASNLLLRAVAGRLNLLLSRLGLAPLIVAEMTRLSDNALGYPSAWVRDRRSEVAGGRGLTIVPDQFREQCVIFMDDLFNTGLTIARAAARLQIAGAADTMYLFAARMDPEVVGATAGRVEDLLNDAFISGTLASVAPMLQYGRFTVVQKLLGIVLNPCWSADLAAFLPEMPTASLLQLVVAASSDGYRHRRQGAFLPSLLKLEAELEKRGALDATGHITGAASVLAVDHQGHSTIEMAPSKPRI